MTRTDIHAPASEDFNPGDYETIGFVNLYPDADDDSWSADMVQLSDAIKAHGCTAAPEYVLGRCTHCGANIRYAAFMLHTPTNTYITVGEDCLGNRFSLTSAAEFQALRKARKLNAGRIDLAAQKAAHVAAAAAVDPRLTILADADACWKISSTFLFDLAMKIARYELSEKQIAAASKTLDRHEEWEARKAAERETASPAPSGKVAVTGTIVTMKWTDSDFPQHKMLVKDDRGFKVWVTVPKALEDRYEYPPEGGFATTIPGADVEDRVTFTVTLEPSGDDPTFAFGKRPTKAAIIETAS
jgi:hypothetical protein